MTNLKFMFRADRTNVGDWWCHPSKFFKFKPAPIGDILNPQYNLDDTDVLIMGGGGIGADFFKPHLERVKNSNVPTTILWGSGVDTKSNRGGTLSPDNQDLYGNYFDFIDEVGIRVHTEPQKFRYVPCVSCMSPLFERYRSVKPKHKLGVYNHKRVTIMQHNNPNNIPVNDNSGDDLESKLKFLSSCEYILTNTYHGVYWATLLERKVICVPFKSGLYSFKHKPTYLYDSNLKSAMDKSVVHRGVLEESRELNNKYYEYLTSKYDIV